MIKNLVLYMSNCSYVLNLFNQTDMDHSPVYSNKNILFIHFCIPTISFRKSSIS